MATKTNTKTTTKRSTTRVSPSSLPFDTVLRTGTILISDSCGFTRSVLEHGPAVALERIHTMRRLLIPVFRHAGGEVYKVEADNLFVFFPTVDAALRGALEAHRVVQANARAKRTQPPFPVGIGIGHGELLYLPSEDDYYGAEVNLASKLGEDTAEAGETFLTEAAAGAVSPDAPGRPGRWRSVVAATGVRIRYRPWAD